MLARKRGVVALRKRRRRKAITHQGRDQRFGFVLVETGSALDRRAVTDRWPPLQNALHRFGVAPQRPRIDRIAANLASGEKSAEQTRLRIPDLGQPVVVFGTESGLSVAHEIYGPHDQ